MLTNQQIKTLKNLSKSKHRQKYNIFVVEGQKAVDDLLSDALEAIHYIVVSESYARLKPSITDAADYPIHVLNDRAYKMVSSQSNPSGILAVADFVKSFKAQDFDQEASVSLYLDKIQDPGNMGTILRIADWYGVEQIVLPKGNVDLYNSKVVQSAMGSLWRHKYIYAEFNELKLSGVVSIATSLNGSELAEWKKENNPKKMLLIMGNESNGVSKDLLNAVNVKLKISKRSSSKIDSLNVAVATAIILEHMSYWRGI